MASALFGLIVLGLGIALRAVQRRFLTGTSIAAPCLSTLGALGYTVTIVAGLVGVTEQDPLGDDHQFMASSFRSKHATAPRQ